LAGRGGSARSLSESVWARTQPSARPPVQRHEPARRRADGPGEFAEAEPLVVYGYEGMKARAATIPPYLRSRLTEAALRVARLYVVWDKPEQAAAWKTKLGLADLPADVFARP
jgi:hypothetical protein